MRTTGLVFSSLFVAAGAILAWAVTYEANGIDLNKVGVILFIVGLVLAAISLALRAVGRRTVIEKNRGAIIDGRPVVRERDVITEQNPY